MLKNNLKIRGATYLSFLCSLFVVFATGQLSFSVSLNKPFLPKNIKVTETENIRLSLVRPESDTQPPLVISYGEPINILSFATKVNGTFLIKKGKNVFYEGSLATLNSYKFTKPGDYTIFFKEENTHSLTECDHKQLPDSINVMVSNIKSSFDLSGVKLSNDVYANKPTDEILLTVPIELKMFKKQKIEYTYNTINIVGVGSNITGTLVKQTKLKNGKHLFTYKLSGIVSEPSYLMIDLKNYNGEIQSYSLPYQIKINQNEKN